MTQRPVFVKGSRWRRRLAAAVAVLVAALLVRTALSLRPPALRAGREWPEIAGVTVVNPGGERRPNQTLRLRSGLIESISDTQADAPLRPRDRLFRGRYVLPGLIDADVRRLPTVGHLRRMMGFHFLLAGVTTVRVVGNFAGDIRRLQEQIAAGAFPWPRLVACGRTLAGERSTCADARIVRDAAGAVAAVDEQMASGAECVAVDRSLGAAALAAVRAAARARQVPVIGDLPLGVVLGDSGLTDVRLISAVRPLPPARGAADWLRGWQALPPAGIDTLVRTLREQGSAVTPNVMRWSWLLLAGGPMLDQAPYAAYLPRFIRDVVWPHELAGVLGPTRSDEAGLAPDQLAAAVAAMQETVRRLHAAGVPLHAGTGTPSPYLVPGSALWLEMAGLTAAGLSPEQAWVAATRSAGAAVGIPGLGIVAAGAPADLLLFREDPTQDLNALRSLDAVISQGRVYTAGQLNRYFLEYARYVEQPLYDRASMALARLSTWWAGDDSGACEPL